MPAARAELGLRPGPAAAVVAGPASARRARCRRGRGRRREGKDGAPDERAANTTSFVMRASEQGGFPAPSPSVKRGVRRRARTPDPAMESDGGAMENPDDLPSPSSGCNPLRLHSRARTGGRARRGEPAVPPELAWTAPTRALSGAGE